MPEADTQLVEAERELAKFRAAQNLGSTALSVQREAERILRSIDDLGLAELHPPEGMKILLRARHPEDPLDAESWIESDEYDEDSTGYWAASTMDYTGKSSYEANVVQHQNGNYFCASSMEWDKDTSTIWAYNEAKDFRVKFRDGIGVAFY